MIGDAPIGLRDHAIGGVDDARLCSKMALFIEQGANLDCWASMAVRGGASVMSSSTQTVPRARSPASMALPLMRHQKCDPSLRTILLALVH